MWSGGTDSHTIYNVFQRNNIHIDEIIIRYESDKSPYPEAHVKWLMENHRDPTTIITPINEYDTRIRGIVVNNEDWLLNNKGDLLRFGQSSVSNATIELCNRNHAGHRWGVVVGLEKPTVIFENGLWYAHQSDRVLRQAMGHDQVECFFLEPIINLKQSHLAKNTLKQLYANGGKINWSDHKENRRHGAIAYAAWAAAVGRHPELTFGMSQYQKRLHSQIMGSKLETINKITDFNPANGETALLNMLKAGDPTAINYVKGLYNLQSDAGFYAYLNEKALEEPDVVIRTKQIWSKRYCLGK